MATRPDSRDSPHLFGLGLKEMLADEITQDLRRTRDQAVTKAIAAKTEVSVALTSKGISYGAIAVSPTGSVDTSLVQGVNPDLRVRPFFAEGSTISIREFIVGALRNELGLMAVDPDLAAANAGSRVVTPSGMVLDGSKDKIDPASTPDPNNRNEIDTAVVDHLEFYLLNYFKPGLGQQDEQTRDGAHLMKRIGCNSCHIANLIVNKDRRVADLNTVYDPVNGVFNSLFATAVPLVTVVDDGSGFPPLKKPAGNPFVAQNIFTDFKRHDVGPAFYEWNYDGSLQTQFLTRPSGEQEPPGLTATMAAASRSTMLFFATVARRWPPAMPMPRSAGNRSNPLMPSSIRWCCFLQTIQLPAWTLPTHLQRTFRSLGTAASSSESCLTIRPIRSK